MTKIPLKNAMAKVAHPIIPEICVPCQTMLNDGKKYSILKKGIRIKGEKIIETR